MESKHARMARNTDRVCLFLQEKGIWEQTSKVEIKIIKQDHRRPEYFEISPLGHLPALELGDGATLTESRAICSYFEALNPEPNLMGLDGRERAIIEMWDRRVELSYMFQIAGWFRNGHPARAELEKPQSVEWSEICQGRARKAIAFFSERLGASPYVAGQRFTIADITLHVALGFGRVVKFRPWEEHASLNEWRERMLARPGLAK